MSWISWPSCLVAFLLETVVFSSEDYQQILDNWSLYEGNIKKLARECFPDRPANAVKQHIERTKFVNKLADAGIYNCASYHCLATNQEKGLL